MKKPKLFPFLLIILSLLLLSRPVYAAEPEIAAKAALVLDWASGEVIWAKNAYTPMPPASTTKIITAVTAIELLPLDHICRVSARAEAIDEASIYLKEGESLTALDLLYAALLKSANDACFCLAENIAGSEPFFVKLLNWKCFAIGAYTAELYNTNGLPHDKHLMSAYDLSLIARYAMNNTVFAELCKTKEAKLACGKYVKNLNKLLRYDDSYIGIKTGTTDAAGACLVSAKRYAGKIYIAVVLNSSDRYGDSIKLLNYASSRK